MTHNCYEQIQCITLCIQYPGCYNALLLSSFPRVLKIRVFDLRSTRTDGQPNLQDTLILSYTISTSRSRLPVDSNTYRSASSTYAPCRLRYTCPRSSIATKFLLQCGTRHSQSSVYDKLQSRGLTLLFSASTPLTVHHGLQFQLVPAHCGHL